MKHEKKRFLLQIMKCLIKNARIVNEGSIIEGDLLINGDRIEQVGGIIESTGKEVDAQGMYLLPGIIDDQVHFREPGLTHKGDIRSESTAALAGGVTSFIEQPNTKPAATTMALLEEKFAIAKRSSQVNYSFNMGAGNDNIEDLLKADHQTFAGVKVFMGSSTGNMLVDNQQVLERIFKEVPHLIITHCEDEHTIKQNMEQAVSKYGADIPPMMHPVIRSAEACYLSSSRAVEMAKKFNTRLHVYHLSTAIETALFDNKLPLAQKRITSEVCIHHLWFNDADYERKGNLIKWNPAVKTANDQEQIWKALLDGRIDVIATDHAPHTLEEKQGLYTLAPSGGPLVQHSLQAMYDFVLQGRISLTELVQKMCHHPAILFRIKDRGYIREGYKADLVLLNPKAEEVVNKENILYKCGWSPFEGERFSSKIEHVWVNGQHAWAKGKQQVYEAGERLMFNYSTN